MRGALSKAVMSILLTLGVNQFYQPAPSFAAVPQSTVLIATAYTGQSLPTLRRGSRGKAVKMLQDILVSNGFLGAAGKRLGRVSSTRADGIFGAVTESAVKDLQQRYNLPVTGIVDPATWEVLDMHENPYRGSLPWKY
jgi:peptidoglycan hydrolase-like protein with peptidoglycan-binding domain